MVEVEALAVCDLPLIILGSGGHAQVLLHVLRQQGYTLLGMTDANTQLTGTQLHSVPILGTDECLQAYPADTVRLVNGLGSVGNTQLRQQIFTRFTQQGYTFQSVQHSTALFETLSQQGAGCQLLAGAIVMSQVQLGANVLINTRAVVEHDCHIGDHCHIASGAVLCGGCRLDAGVHVGANATLLQGIQVGANAVIGAGAVVTQTVAADSCVLGVPARRQLRTG